MNKQSSIKRFLSSDKAIWLLVFLALIVRVMMFFHMGSGTLSHSDDVAYLQSGIVFAKTGVISVWTDYPTASIMPGMPVLAGLMCKLFGEGTAYIDSIRILWMILGSITPYVLYKSCCFFMPRAYALFAAAGFLLPNWAWSDNAVLTETPYLLFYMTCMYFTFRMGQPEGEKDKVAVAGFVLSFMAALMFRANILIYLPFAAAYLLILGKKRLRELLRPALALALAMLVFVIPWSVRNYRIFGEFIPITSGTANPTLLGTYQGDTAPLDESLDYETNVYKIVREQYPEAFNADGSFKDLAESEKFGKIAERLKTEYRLKVWFENDPWGLIWAYFFSKPACMLNWVWIWLPLPRLYYTLRFFSQINMVMCIIAVLLSLFMKKKRDITLYLGFTYVINIYIIAMSFASERYAAMHVPLRYMIAAMGLHLAVELIKEKRAKKAQLSCES